DDLWRPLPHWLIMASLAPFAVAFSARFRVRPGRLRLLPLHVAAAFAFAVLHIFLGTLMYSAILRSPRPVGIVVRAELAFDIALELMAYAVIAVGTHAYLWLDEARRERETAARAEADLASARLRIL